MDTSWKIMVVGAGTMGHGIAQCVAMAGFNVRIVDQFPGVLDKAKVLVKEHLEGMVREGRIDAELAEASFGRMEFHDDLEASAAWADFVFEAVFEDLQVKRELFHRLGALTRPDVVLTSNTSSFDIAKLCDVTQHPERVIGMHWFHPPQITPCIEVIPAGATSAETVETAKVIAEAVRKYPTACANSPGFVANRIQFAMAAEALAIVEEGLATPEEVDRIVTSSFGFRLSAFGPFEIADQAGIDVYLSIFKYLHEMLGRGQFAPPPLLEKMVQDGKLGLKSGAGFYDYGDDAADALRRTRDKRLFDRLALFRAERMDGSD
ncbi:3-hydroxyacyl-CoA dehydrogenase family protein [Oceanidesulfovibrio marinus]|uniref:3-hydroxyacyl-CoA dehydrogenase family protein n=1 Tax=Oceanidesulfovibrio marinus TaxID=370038 RepID=A0ABX6NGQ7_9BACT|nr:3-hydroxyacyl-CoA dehydrogenase family protein [Oceanidesulfovibrio marinus]QJT09825.1 3-hydroxyacyl-CoA dehydrogenase family protein [Oceanidesulfovibrio marinus]